MSYMINGCNVGSPSATLMASEKLDNKIEKHYKYI